MIAKKEIEKLPVLPIKAEGKKRYTGRIYLAGDAIVMDVYKKEESCQKLKIKFRWVCDKKNYYTYLFQKQKWTSRGIYCAWSGDCSFWSSSVEIPVDPESERTAGEFLKDFREDTWKYRKDAANRLLHLEEFIREKRRRKREEQREERIRKRQEAKKPLPGDFDHWLKTTVFKANRYLFYDAKKRKQGFCAYCGAEVKLDGEQKHNASGKCPACRSRVIYKAEGLAKTVSDKKQAIYLQKTETGFLTRYITAWKQSSRDGERYKSEEIVLATWNGEKTWYDYREPGARYWQDVKPVGMNSWRTEGYLYTKNVKHVLKDTLFQYAPLHLWMRHEKKEIPVCDFLARYQTSPFLEFMIKTGLYRLTTEYVKSYERWSGKTPEEILGIDRQRIKRLAAMNGGMLAHEWLQYEQEEGIKISDADMQWLENEKVRVQSSEEILASIGSVARMVNYMKKQEIQPKELAIIWGDYLRMAGEEGMDLSDDIIRFPKNLKQRHDELVELGNEKKDQQRLKEYGDLDRKIQELLPEMRRYCWENEMYQIIPAAGCRELMEEGRKLHHCVGRDDYYMKKMAEGKTWICFLRKKEDLQKPYYTLEIDIKTDHILQWYSEFDRKPDERTIKGVLKTFQNAVKRKHIKRSA